MTARRTPLARCALALGLSACQLPGSTTAGSGGSTPAPAKIAERTFQRADASGEEAFTVRVRATEKVPPAALDVLAQELRIVRAGPARSAEERAFWRDRPLPLDPGRAEVSVELVPAAGGGEPGAYVWTWPDLFHISRSGVLEVKPEAAKLVPRTDPATDAAPALAGAALRTAAGPAVARLAADAAAGPQRVRGRVLCKGAELPHLAVVADGRKAETGADGRFEIEGPFGGVPSTLFLAYEAPIPLSTGVSARLQIFDDAHATRNDRVDRTPSIEGGVASFGDVEVPSDDCVLWQLGIRALRHYFDLLGAPPPAGELRVKRWSAVYQSSGARAHTFYDYIVAPTDLAASGNRRTFFHEFGHSIRHVADADRDKTHWDWDNFRFIYARLHDGGQVTNKAFVFNEGWGHYWAAAVEAPPQPVPAPVPNPSPPVHFAHKDAPADPAFMDFNEDRVGQRLIRMSGPVGHAFMVRVLLSNPGAIHTLQQFEERYCAALGQASNEFCAGGRPTRTPASCPPGYIDDGLTCRLDNIISKPSVTRGVGTVPSACGAGREYDAGLCYPRCPAGYSGVGPVCWQQCPAGYSDDGATCRRNAHIFGSNNSACPWYDRCGVTFARGCSVCPPGYSNDGCTCRRDAHIFGKRTQTRGAGTVPDSCGPGRQYDAGLCYPACPAGFSGVGPVCWGSCPTGYADHGATCYRAPNVFSDDPVVPP